MTHPTRSLLAATLGLAVLAGCASLPLPSASNQLLSPTKTATNATGATRSTPFVSAASAKANLTSVSQAKSRTDAKALASNDEALVENVSAGMETDESKASYQLAGVSEAAAVNFDDGGFSDGFGLATPNRQAAPVGNRPGQGAAYPVDDRGGMQPMPIGNGRGANTQVVVINNGRAQGRDFDGFVSGEFGGGRFNDPRVPAPRIERRAAPQTIVVIQLNNVQVNQLTKRRAQAQATQKQFVQKQPQNAQDDAMIRQVLESQPWQKADADGATLSKSGTSSLTLGNGVSRKIAVLRVVQAAKPHALVQAQTDIADVYADGGTKTVHWEKALQEDGSYVMVYHHEITSAKGQKWVADWTKTLSADGKLTGSGTFTETDADGKLVSEQKLTIGGNDTTGQTITTDEPVATATPTPSPSATATPAPEASTEPEATASPEPSASPAEVTNEET